MAVLKTKIHELRKENNMNQSELAEKVGVRRETIGALENGKYNPSLKLAMDIAKVFSRSVEDIFEFVDENGEADKDNAVLKIVTNKRLIAVDQDALGKPAKRIKKSRGIDIIARPLSNGDVAVCFLNCKSCSNSVRYNISDLSTDEYLNFPSASSYELHNLWSDERTTGTTISATMPKHGVMVYRIKAQ